MVHRLRSTDDAREGEETHTCSRALKKDTILRTRLMVGSRLAIYAWFRSVMSSAGRWGIDVPTMAHHQAPSRAGNDVVKGKNGGKNKKGKRSKGVTGYKWCGAKETRCLQETSKNDVRPIELATPQPSLEKCKRW